MTLIAVALADDAVIQVSDCRLTLPDGSVFTDQATKAVCGTCSDAKFSIGYTGLARVGKYASDTPTDHWIVDVLNRSGLLKESITAVVDYLRAAANRDFGSLNRLNGINAGLTLVLTGFGQAGPFCCLISNLEAAGIRHSGKPRKEFTVNWWHRNDATMRKLGLMICGAEQAVNNKIEIMIKKFRKRGLSMTPERRVSALVQIVRAAADHRISGKLIGKHCMSITAQPFDGFIANYHSLKSTPLAYLPHHITSNMAMKDIRISSDEKTRHQKGV